MICLLRNNFFLWGHMDTVYRPPLLLDHQELRHWIITVVTAIDEVISVNTQLVCE